MPSTIEDQLVSYCSWVEERSNASMRPPAPRASIDDGLVAADVSAATESRRGHERPLVLMAATVAAGLILLVALAVLTPSSSQRLSPATPDASSETTLEPSTTQDSTLSTSKLTVSVPPTVGEELEGDPILRFLGFPADENDSAEYARLAMDQAVGDCMFAAGYYYAVPQPTNTDIAQGSAAYQEALKGVGGCGEQANSRVYLLPSFQAEFAELESAVRYDPAAVEASTALTDCLNAHGVVAASDPDTPPEACDAANERSSEVQKVLMWQLAPEWIERHTVALEARRNDIADLVRRARNSEHAEPVPDFNRTPFEVTGQRVGEAIAAEGFPPGLDGDGNFDPSRVPEWIPVSVDGLTVGGFLYGPSYTAQPPPPGTQEPASHTTFYDDSGDPIGEFGPDGYAHLFD